MRKWLTVFAICVVTSAVLGLYRFEIHGRQLESELSSLNKSLLESQQAIQVLEAEWAFLTQPARLQALAIKHLVLVPTLPSQVATIADVPVRGELLPLAGGDQPKKGKNVILVKSEKRQ
jgi:hypothetical protein